LEYFFLPSKKIWAISITLNSPPGSSVFIPSFIIIMQNGQAVAKIEAPVSRTCPARTTFIR